MAFDVEGFQFTEGPVWVTEGKYLRFSDPNSNNAGNINIFRTPNGLTLDAQGRLTINEHGNRRVSRVEKDGSVTALAERYNGKRLNSPNDVVLRSNGDMYFTDPPFGLPKAFDDPERELDFCGVYRLSKEGKLALLTRELGAPNGIAFSSDEKKLYLSDSKAAAWLVYEVKDDGTIANGRTFFEASAFKKIAQQPGRHQGGCEWKCFWRRPRRDLYFFARGQTSRHV